MSFEGIVTLVVFVVVVALITFILSRYSYELQAIAITVLIVIAFAIDRLLLHFFREHLVKQWYFTSIYSWKRGNVESIIVPFIFIGAIVYWLTQRLIIKYYRKRRLSFLN